MDANDRIRDNDYKPLYEVLNKMCSFVGKTLDDIDLNDNEWFLKNEWTIDDENKFKDWMVDFLLRDSSARKLLLSSPTKNKKFLRKAANEFVFNYGWKIKNETV